MENLNKFYPTLGLLGKSIRKIKICKFYIIVAISGLIFSSIIFIYSFLRNDGGNFNINKAVVMVKADKGWGTGFFIEKKYLLTAGHVVGNSKIVDIIIKKDKEHIKEVHKAKVVYTMYNDYVNKFIIKYNSMLKELQVTKSANRKKELLNILGKELNNIEKYDWALLKVTDNYVSDSRFKLGKSSGCKLNDDVTLAGYFYESNAMGAIVNPDSATINVFKSSITSFKDGFIIIKQKIDPGYSGSPVIKGNKIGNDNKVIGIAIEGYNKKLDIQSIGGFILPIDYVRNGLKKAGFYKKK